LVLNGLSYKTYHNSPTPILPGVHGNNHKEPKKMIYKATIRETPPTREGTIMETKLTIEVLEEGKMNINKDETLTIFRKFKEGDIIALFPEIEHHWPFCSSYQHIGQHSGADYEGLIQITKPATPEEYNDLKTELESIGYNIKIRQKWNRRHK